MVKDILAFSSLIVIAIGVLAGPLGLEISVPPEAKIIQARNQLRDQKEITAQDLVLLLDEGIHQVRSHRERRQMFLNNISTALLVTGCLTLAYACFSKKRQQVA